VGQFIVVGQSCEALRFYKDAAKSFDNGYCDRVGLIIYDQKGCTAFFQHGTTKQDNVTILFA